MKNFTIILTLVIAITTKINAQIPNGELESLNGWFTGNASLSTDHYPLSVGNYSIKLENQLPLVNNESYGYAVSGNTNSGCIPSFAITGHPNQLCGYYKCSPLNNDTIQIGIMLFDNGVWVAGAELITTNTVSNWTSFCIPISNYTNADSATITVAAFYNDTTCGMPYGPHGNSVLYVDNLSFDNLITSTTELHNYNSNISIYPNPASDNIFLNFDKMIVDDITVSIYNTTGTLIKTEILKRNQNQMEINDLNNGIYIISFIANDFTVNQRLVIQR